MLGLVVADVNGGVRGDFGRPVVARLQHALAAQDLEALVVTVGGAAAGVDLREPSAARADRHRRRIDVAGRLDRRIGQAAAGRVDGRGLVVENPAEDVEVVDQHVLEDAAGDLDVIDRRRAGIAAGDDQHFRLADLAGVDARLQRGERRIVAALEADQAGHAGALHRFRGADRAREIEIDRLFAEDRLAGRLPRAAAGRRGCRCSRR